MSNISHLQAVDCFDPGKYLFFHSDVFFPVLRTKKTSPSLSISSLFACFIRFLLFPFRYYSSSHSECDIIDKLSVLHILAFLAAELAVLFVTQRGYRPCVRFLSEGSGLLVAGWTCRGGQILARAKRERIVQHEVEKGKRRHDRPIDRHDTP